ncbi:phosphatase PAP2 family protein [Janibacter cremeus]|uniref:phosphatase PAP2 family protein n=1 Tax=Janibacter cremeus TaxID=1285192 RepID=UPI0023F75BFC|nr:phosphatase PAP2 family protein [Janibacter cremeus]WEV78510.1 phosphatase PAP2 family protein [Janibacter cremeus]
MTSKSSRWTSAPALAGALVVVTLLAAGPLRSLDAALQGYWAKRYTPNWFGFLDTVPNAVAGQAVCLPVLLLVAVVLARRHRTWHPLAIVVAAEVAFYAGVGGMKILLGRTSPAAGSGRFWEGGVLEHGWYGIAYPSGHAAEAILFYGAAAYLLRTYAAPDVRIRKRLNALVGLITANAVLVSFYLGFHWPTDLLGGMLAGALMLRIIVDIDRRIAAGRPVLGWQPPTVRTAAPARPSRVATRTAVPPVTQSANDLPPMRPVTVRPMTARPDSATAWPGPAPFARREPGHPARSRELQTTGKG